MVWFPRITPLPSLLPSSYSLLFFPSVFFVSPFLPPSSAGPFIIHTRQCLTLFRHFFCCCRNRCRLYKSRLVKPDICIPVFVFGLRTSSSPPSIGISRLRHHPRRGHLLMNHPPHQPLSCGAAQRQATNSGQATPSRVDGKRRRMSFRLPSSFARMARADAGPRSGPRSLSRARVITTCLCASSGCLSFLLAPSYPRFL
jgi:hypothetical protein